VAAGGEDQELKRLWALEEGAIRHIDAFSATLLDLVEKGTLNQVRQFVQKEMKALLILASLSEHVKLKLEGRVCETFQHCIIIL
jgi:hypothetical protein